MSAPVTGLRNAPASAGYAAAANGTYILLERPERTWDLSRVRSFFI